MEEDAGVKAPVTRLRRRLSVEQTEESKSPAVNTPTKKRGGRKTAKPELELIDENTPETGTTRRGTRKAAAKEIIDSVEEKPVTPSRRSTRIKSNTSIVSETLSVVDSPRAKRATRRNSQLGSDNEAPVTPIRQTRRTRKDSTSSIEKGEVQSQPAKPLIQITDVIEEEPETTTRKSTNNTESINNLNTSPGSIRKSPRLIEKTKKRDSTNSDSVSDNTKISQNENISEDANKKDSEDSSLTKSSETRKDESKEKKKLSISSSNLINDLNTENRVLLVNLNKSTSAIENKNKSRRNRTKSWTNNSASNESSFHSDNESVKKKIINEVRSPLRLLNKSGAGDGISNESKIKLDNSFSKRKKKSSMSFVVEDVDKSLTASEKSTNDNKKVSSDKDMSSLTTELFSQEPSKEIQTLVFIEDSDSNSSKIISQSRHDNEDQCVPVVNHEIEKISDNVLNKNDLNLTTEKQNSSLHVSKSINIANTSCEPMDVDETIPESLLLNELPTKDHNLSERKSFSTSIQQETEDINNDTNNKSRRKSSLKNLNKSNTENKSTLILSQLKDSSMAEINSTIKSPQIVNKVLLSKTSDDLNISQENDIHKKNLSLHYQTSTPLQQKHNMQKLALNVNTSIITPHNDSKDIIEKVENSSFKKISSKENVSQKDESISGEKSHKVNESVQKSPKKIFDSTKETEDSEEESCKDSSNTKRQNKNQENKSNKLDSKEIADIEVSLDESKSNKNKSKKSQKSNSSAILNTTNSENKNDVSNSKNNGEEQSDEDVVVKKGKDKNKSRSSQVLNTSANKLEKSKSNVQESEEDSDKEMFTKKVKDNKNKSNNSRLQNSSIISNDSEEEIDSDEESQENSNLMDDEAEDAGDDYESGDSQDESERQYIQENEIVERGETLTSDDDFSDDSDYEKDSFVVSSDEEDNELLDGTEDDLSMSDNELKMTAKSKAKYNERKMKEQKKASREMFESRHKINNSKNSNSKIKTSESSNSESEDDTSKIPRKINRMRLDSSHETSMIENNSEMNLSKKKRKRLSESVCNDSAINEKEITVCNNSVQENDPLTTEVKEEPKTPKKDGNSTIAFIDSEEINEENIDKNESTKTQTELMDPLDDDMNCDDDDSMSSDNVNIMQNYDSILNDLNKTNKTKSKTCDISLNLDKKSKKKEKTAIVDELNLTQVKSKKKSKKLVKDEIKNDEKKTLKSKPDDGDSSDSIDLHLLFSEDSTNSDDADNKKKTDSTKIDDYIPLKRTEGKTDLHESKDTKQNISINESISKKNKKRKSVTGDNLEETNVSFFIDTEGTHSTLNTSTKKNKKKTAVENDVSFKIDKKGKSLTKEKSVLDSDLEESEDETDNVQNKYIPKTTVSSDDSDSDAPEEIPYKKEKNVSLIISKEREESSEGEDETDAAPKKSMKNSILSSSEKRNKKKNESSILINDDQSETKEAIKNIMNISLGSTKKKKKMSISEPLEKSITVTEDVENMSVHKSLMKTPSSEKKKKRLSESTIEQQTDQTSNELHNQSKAKTPDNGKKKKGLVENQTDLPEDVNNLSKVKTPNSHKKTKSQTEQILHQTAPITENIDTSCKKRKRKSSLIVPCEEPAQIESDDTANKLNESLIGSKKKKRKISHQDEDVTPIHQEENIFTDKRSTDENINVAENATEQANKKRNKKRKEREDDEENTFKKVRRENSSDKLHVPRLPSSILNKLDDKPLKKGLTAKKSKIVSTTQFVVEEAKIRKNKPSNYLEESVYLNDDETERKKKKERLSKPKVLPFVPTASTSNSGYTTNFKVNVIPTETKFVAQSNTINNFKNNYLNDKKIKRQGTYELYKRNRNMKISKF